MSGNKWWTTKVEKILLSDLATFSTFLSDIALDFHESIRVVPLKYLMYFLAGINIKYIWNIPEQNYFTPLRILNLFSKSFVNPFVDIALTFFDSSFNSFLFEVTFYIFSSKSVFFTKAEISFLIAKFACANLAVKFSAINLLNSGVAIYLSSS